MSPDPAAPAASPLGSSFASPWYFRAEDNLRLTSYNALAAVRLELRYRMLDTDGRIQVSQETQSPNTDRSAKASILITPEGWLLGGEIFVSGAAPLEGQSYVVVEIVRGTGTNALPLQVIAAGYVTAKQPLPFPGVQIGSSLDGGGALRSISGATPAAGAEILETVPTGARWELLSLCALFTASATVANRQMRLRLVDGATIFGSFGVAGNAAASYSGRSTWAQGATGPTQSAGGEMLTSLPSGLRLTAGQQFATSTTGLQVGDQWSAIQYLVREWLEGA